MQNVEISFRGSEDNGTLFAAIHNPSILPGGLYTQIRRYGLSGPSNSSPLLSGPVKGTRRALTELIYTYGFAIEVVPLQGTAAADR
jgi:hypothetical protein